jgi:hypothetical protein
MTAAMKNATPGDHAHRTSSKAHRTDPSAIIRAAPKRSSHTPVKGAASPPAKSAAEKVPNTASRLKPTSFAMPGARMLKL